MVLEPQNPAILRSPCDESMTVRQPALHATRRVPRQTSRTTGRRAHLAHAQEVYTLAAGDRAAIQQPGGACRTGP